MMMSKRPNVDLKLSDVDQKIYELLGMGEIPNSCHQQMETCHPAAFQAYRQTLKVGDVMSHPAEDDNHKKSVKAFFDKNKLKNYKGLKVLPNGIKEIYTPRYGSKEFDSAYNDLYRDYEIFKGRNYRGYSICKNVLRSAIRKSGDYEVISFSEKTKTLVFREKTKDSVIYRNKKSRSPESSSCSSEESVNSPIIQDQILKLNQTADILNSPKSCNGYLMNSGQYSPEESMNSAIEKILEPNSLESCKNSSNSELSPYSSEESLNPPNNLNEIVEQNEEFFKALECLNDCELHQCTSNAFKLPESLKEPVIVFPELLEDTMTDTGDVKHTNDFNSSEPSGSLGIWTLDFQADFGVIRDAKIFINDFPYNPTLSELNFHDTPSDLSVGDSVYVANSLSALTNQNSQDEMFKADDDAKRNR